MANFKMGIGSNIKLLRKMAGITQEELAEIIGIHSRQLSKIETGEYFPSCKTLEKICMALDVEPQNLFNFEFLAEESELAMTGTDNKVYYKFDNLPEEKSNILHLKKDNKSKNTKTICTDESMSKLAKSLNKPIFAEYFLDKTSSKLMVFYPDGREKVIKSEDDAQEKQELLFLMKEIRKIVKDKHSLEFIKTAISSLNDNENLKKLDILVDGMKLVRKVD